MDFVLTDTALKSRVEVGLILSAFAHHNAKGKGMLQMAAEKRTDNADDVKRACLKLMYGLHDLEATLDTMLPDVLTVVDGRVGETPVVFWRKWGRTTGRQMLPSIGGRKETACAEYHTNECSGKHVVFVEGGEISTSHLFYGVDAAYEVGARSIGVVTSRRFYTDEDLKDIRKEIDWVLISDNISDQRARMEEHCPSVFFPFPFVRRRYLPLPSFED